MMEIKGFLQPADAIVPCKACGAREGEPCIETERDKREPGSLKPGFVHFGRRVSRMLLTARRPELRDRIEEELVELLAKELKERALQLARSMARMRKKTRRKYPVRRKCP